MRNAEFDPFFFRIRISEGVRQLCKYFRMFLVILFPPMMPAMTATDLLPESLPVSRLPYSRLVHNAFGGFVPNQ